MRVLLIKTSSMGDLIHTFPALTDASKAIPGIQFDWVVEESFTSIPVWHPAVADVIPVALRRLRKKVFSKDTFANFYALRKRLRERQYDLVLDAQGLVKSALLTYLAKGKRVGLDWRSARESLASLAYQKKYTVNFYQHAIVRMRQLFSLALDYPLPTTAPEFSLNRAALLEEDAPEKYLVFLHGTTWDTKLWPERYWVALANMAERAGYRIKISGGSDVEVARAERMAMHSNVVDVMPRTSITAMARLLANAKGAVAVDTGFGHLAAALDVPTVSIYGSTNPAYTGALGKHSLHLAAHFPCSPCLSRTCTYKKASDVAPACYTTVGPDKVWEALQKVIILSAAKDLTLLSG